MKNTNFTLQHTVLYAKGWYKRNDFWEDIKKCLTADGYSGDIMDASDCANVIFNQFQKLEHRGGYHDTWNILSGITDSEIWKYGFHTKTNFGGRIKDAELLPEYSYYMAIVHYCLSYFVQIDRNEFNVCEPDAKVLPLTREEN